MRCLPLVREGVLHIPCDAMRAGTLHYPLHRPLTTNLFLPAKILQEILHASTFPQKFSTNIPACRANGARLGCPRMGNASLPARSRASEASAACEGQHLFWINSGKTPGASRGLRANSANRVTAAAIVAAPVHIARIEVQVVRVVRIALVERTRPIVAVGTDIVD